MTIKRPRIFLDSGDPAETHKAKSLLGFLDGQTTNPSLVAKNPEIQAYMATGKKLTETELLNKYKELVGELQKTVAGPISVETYADWTTTAEDMLEQAYDMKTWGRNIYIKFPTIPAGIEAAHKFVTDGGSVNMTLVFDQTQAAAVYTATMPSIKPAFISPFVGRWDDRGYKGMDLIKNIIKMYKNFNKIRNERRVHVEVLAASIRTMDHFYSAMVLGADILTVPLSIIQEWIDNEQWMPDTTYRPETKGLKSIIYQDLPYHDDYMSYPVEHVEGSLLDEGVGKFVKDWKSLLDS